VKPVSVAANIAIGGCIATGVGSGLPDKHAVDTFSTDSLRADLKGRSVRGGLLTLTSQGSQFFLQSISTVVLARLLAPSDFGLVAMVTAITGLGQAFADLGLSEATIQREDISHEQVSTLFWINVALGFVLMLISAGLAPVLAWFYREPRLELVTLVVSLTFLIGGLRVQHDAILRRQMRFKSLAVRDIFSYVVAVPLAIVLAWRGAGYWALVALPLTLNVIQMVCSWTMARWIPGLPSRRADVGSLLAFGGRVAVSYVIYTINRSADNVLVGWRWGAGPLGLYSRAYNLLMLPIRQLNAPARAVAVPAFSRLQDDPQRFARYYLRAVNLMMWVSTPMFAFLFVLAEPVIVLVLGSQWREAAPVFQILAISALGQLILDSTVWLFVSRGESGRLLKLFLLISPVIIGSYAVGLPFGIKGVALSGSLVLIGICPWMLKFAFRGTQLTLAGLGRALLCPVSTSVLAALTAKAALELAAPQGLWPQMLVAAGCFAAIFGLSATIPAVRRELSIFKDVSRQRGVFKRITRASEDAPTQERT
jgi:O-antigen/teichoic acid export membrane protein